ncbi:MAG: hypothetical protein AAF485_14195, partial [Chloroflexota bacterium]
FLQNSFGSRSRNPFIAYFEVIYSWSIQITYRLITGDSLTWLDPIGTIPQISPRPILLIYGSSENNRPGYNQQAAAGDNAELWIVSGATHGTYWTAAPDMYEQRIVAFFDDALK